MTQPVPSTVEVPKNSLPDFLTARKPLGESTPARRSEKRWWSQALVGLAILAVLGSVGAGGWTLRSKLWRVEDPTLRLAKFAVAKANLNTTLTGSGRVESSANTIISCEIERLELRSGGQSISSGGASTILSLVDEGTEVHKGDILCTLDSSDYEELVRTQEIKTLQAAAALRQAELSFEVAEIAVKEYVNGLHGQNLQTMKGALNIAQSDLERAADRLGWTDFMLGKGYLPAAKKTDAEQSLSAVELDLQTASFAISKPRSRSDGTRSRQTPSE